MNPYDMLGIGFGPANLALAVSLNEFGHSKSSFKIAFLEKKPEFSWHSGMLIPNAEMQISFLKDLALFRNPSSKFTFVNYLWEKGRLESFANLRSFYPTRLEYHDYLKWVAAFFADIVHYNEEVETIEPVSDHLGEIELLRVAKKNIITGERTISYARNISIATGLQKHIPSNLQGHSHANVIHSSEFLYHLPNCFPDKNADYKFIVIGAGQSAAEIVLNLAETYPNAKIVLCIRGFALKPADETEFVNEIFSSQSAKKFYFYGAELKNQIINAHKNTNYSVTDPELITTLYRKIYHQLVSGDNQIEIKQFHQCEGIKGEKRSWRAIFTDLANHRESSIDFDGLFLATGYRSYHEKLLSNIQQFLEFDDKSRISIDENYAIKARSKKFHPKIYVQGASEHSHGLSETLLSLTAVRSGKISNDLILNRLPLVMGDCLNG